MRAYLERVQKQVDKKLYLALLAFLSFADTFVMILPMDGLLASSAMAKPRRWGLFAFATSLASSLGNLLLVLLVSHYGTPWVESHFPGVMTGTLWQNIHLLFFKYGMIFLFVYAATPFPQQPIAILAGLNQYSFGAFLVASFLGRSIKCLLISYAGAKSPGLLRKIWGIKGELKDVGLEHKVGDATSIETAKRE